MGLGLFIIQKIRIFLFPPALFWYPLNSNLNQKHIIQASKLIFFELPPDHLLLVLSPSDINQIFDSLRSSSFFVSEILFTGIILVCAFWWSLKEIQSHIDLSTMIHLVVVPILQQFDSFHFSKW